MSPIKIKIVRFDPNNHSALVRYFSDIVTEDWLAQHNGHGYIPRLTDGSPENCRTDHWVNVTEVPVPKGEALITYLTLKSPPNEEWFVLQEKVIDPNKDTTMHGIQLLVGKAFEVPVRPVQLIALSLPSLKIESV